MKAKWIFSHYSMNPLGQHWCCFQCGSGSCDSFTSFGTKPQHCADRLRKAKIENIRKQTRGGLQWDTNEEKERNQAKVGQRYKGKTGIIGSIVVTEERGQ